MKTLKLIGMAFMAVFLSVNLIACSSSDDEPSENGGSNTNKTKKLVEIKEIHENYVEIYTFKYNKDDKLSEILEYDEGELTCRTTIDWGHNSIIASEIFDDDDIRITTYTLSNGLIISSKDERGTIDTYTYNSSNLLTKLHEKWTDGEEDIDTWEWKNDKLVKYVDDIYDIYTYTYSGKTCKGWAPVTSSDDRMWHEFENDVLFYAHPNLVGINGTHLPDKIETNSVDDGTVQIEYTFDEEGYVIMRRGVEEDGYTTIYQYKWE